MSILPSSNLASTSSSSSQPPSQYPNSNHGHVSSQPLQLPHSPTSTSTSPSPSQQAQALQSLRISNSESQSSVVRFDNVSGLVAPDANDCGRFSKKVNESGKLYGKRSLAHQNNGVNSRSPAVGQRGFGSAHQSEELSSSPKGQQNIGSINNQGRTVQSAGRKNQIVNGNHLLNFRYDPISRPQARAPPPPRRQQKRKPYNKDLFLQANYKFVVLDSGNYAPESMDPDRMLQWEDIICVKYSTPFPVHCPICLEDPLCPQITSCGHIFCFPCILRYFLMGEDDHKGECWKKCPLCFMTISSKDLYTIYIENVKQHCVGDIVEFMLLTRQKDSFTLSLKNKPEEIDTYPEDDDSFSKFTFTSDVDLSVRKAISDLDGWLAKADSGLVDDLGKLPYVCAAMEQLEQRKKYWNEHSVCNGNKANYSNGQTKSYASSPPANATNVGHGASDFVGGTLSNNINNKSKWLGRSGLDKLNVEASLDPTVAGTEPLENEDEVLSSSYDDSQSLSSFRNRRERDSYNFYQAVDGQHLILHPLNMKCLLRHHGSYDMLPHRISGKILQLETVTQSEAIRRRYRYLSHFSLTTTFQLSEIDLGEILPFDALSPFMDEIKNREKQRKRLAKKEQKEKIKAEVAAPQFVPGQSFHDDPPTFTMDDFEALGSSSIASSSPPTVGERKLLSSITRLGFASGHDSPALRVEETQSLPPSGVASDPSTATGARNSSSPSFASIISRSKPFEGIDGSKMNEIGKKGKKPSRVLLSTAGGRRY